MNSASTSPSITSVLDSVVPLGSTLVSSLNTTSSTTSKKNQKNSSNAITINNNNCHLKDNNKASSTEIKEGWPSLNAGTEKERASSATSGSKRSRGKSERSQGTSARQTPVEDTKRYAISIQ